MNLEHSKLLNNRYALIEKIGQGGMGGIHKAMDTFTGQQVAVKSLIKSSLHLRRRFAREYAFLKKVEHAHLVKVLDFFMVKQTMYMVQELIEGKNLAELLLDKREELDLAQKLSIANKIARAVEVLHCADIVHRDIKPENIMIDMATDNIKLLDLGAGKDTTGAFGKITMDEGLLGTLSYMSPEQANGIFLPQSDIFSLGVTLHQLFLWNSHSVFYHGNPMTVLFRTANYQPNIKDEIRQKWENGPALPIPMEDEISEILITAMAKDPENRDITAGQIAEEFAYLQRKMLSQNFIASDSVSLCHPMTEEIRLKALEFRRQQEKEIVQKRYNLLPGVIFALSLLLGLNFYWLNAKKEKNIMPEESREKARPDREQAHRHFLLSRQFFHQGKYSEAQKQLQFALDIFPDVNYIGQKSLLLYFRKDGLHNKKNAEKIMNKIIGKLEQKRDYYSCQILALAYTYGIGITKNFEIARYWTEQGIEKNNPECMLFLAIFYYSGEHGLEKNNARAIQYATMAASAGVADAMAHLALHYQKIGDNAKALEWCRRGVEKQSPHAMYMMAEMIANTAPDRAHALLLKAAERHSESAMKALGKKYWIARNLKKAIEWYTKAIDHQSDKSKILCHRLGNLYLSAKNLDKAMEYFILCGKDHAGGLFGIAKVYFYRKRYTEAMYLLRHIRKNYGGSFPADIEKWIKRCKNNMKRERRAIKKQNK